MARAYGATGNRKYKNYFDDILEIRNGEQERPENYHRVYWDLRMPEGTLVPLKSGKLISFDQLLSELNLRQQEQYYLTAAREESDALTLLENEAFGLVTAGKKEEAINVLYSQSYFLAKAKIMKNINKFHELLK